MNRPNYFNVIEERLNLLAERIKSRGRLNMLEFNIHAESFYQHFLNELYGWVVLNENEIKQNAEAIDLVDHTNKLILQVSATASKQKIQSSLSKDSIKNYKGYTFKFVSIARDADELRKETVKNPHGIAFNPASDIIDKNSILSKIRGLNINDQERIYKFVKKELVNEIDPLKLESNLATVINILSKEDWNKQEPVGEVNSFEIDRKISHNILNSSKILIDDYSLHYSRVDKIYTVFDIQGSNKSKSVLSTIRQEYAKLKVDFSDDKLFFEIISRIQEKVLNSSNYTTIPFDELELCINILVVDAFIRCKIFENPKDYNYATS
ncbi:ABC-three component system protein [Arcicella rigui]|uniref:ABC-three component system protein n=1 Tax=Arcicella rigui TaxID=797020 RepID=A0ABU5QF53_9BACT|nr:ABC-three component system protein [Arcicella rigui]MEA5140949.1 ABC-three component system protein [Arcicella rigui]